MPQQNSVVMRFYQSLYFKLSSGLVVIMITVGLCYTLFAGYMVQKFNQTGYQKINQDLAENLVRDNKIVHDGRIDRSMMDKTFMHYMMINPSIEIYYLDLQGKIISCSAEPGEVKRERVNLKPVYALLNNNNSTMLGDDPRAPDRQKPFSVAPIPDESNPEGYLYVMLQSEAFSNALNAQSEQATIYLGGIVLAGSLLIGLLIGLFLFYRIHRRLKKLQDSVSQFVASNFSGDRFSVSQLEHTFLRDEISDLEQHIALMAEHIQKQLAALKQQDKLRREMVANISHDLRTPLASIQGYLETLSIKYHKVSEADRKLYIDTAMKQAASLQKLIESLFELAKLDAQEHSLKMENFPLLDLVYDVVAKFHINAQKKNIRLEVISEPQNPVVYADLGLIERVLDNLINNAIYYSHEGGLISIKIDTSNDEHLIINVCDNGHGIAEDQKELVFERFHQAHTPERKDGHAGLGLCIVKKIIELHQQKVWVESQINKGSQFKFTLLSA
jgi:two-component system, OmpR family, sensor kinase